MVDSTPSGIDGLDRILDGGLVRNSTTLVNGAPGTGKSVLGLQYLYEGATNFGESGIYLSLTEDASDLEEAALSLGFEQWPDLVESGNILIHDKREFLQESDVSAMIDQLLATLDDGDYDRLVLDSWSMFQLFLEDEQEKRTYLLKFSDILRDSGLTSLFINEQGGLYSSSELGGENFLTDGIVLLIQSPTEDGENRYVWVEKMRKRDIESDIFPMEIGEGGITIHETAADVSIPGNDSVIP